MVAFAQADDQENDRHRSISQNPQAIVPGFNSRAVLTTHGLTSECSLSKAAYNTNTTTQGSDYNIGATAFTSFAGTDTLDSRHSLCFLSPLSNWENTWFMDIGASGHMCHNKDLFINLEVLVRPDTVNLPNGTFMTVTHCCTVMINNTLALYGVFYILGFKYNLLLLSKLLAAQCLSCLRK